MNNYGRHAVQTAAKATAYVWDWCGLAAPIAGVGMISINGDFLAWSRWTAAGLAAADDLLRPVLGDPVYELAQLSMQE